MGSNIGVHRNDIIKEGFLEKRSKHFKVWRKR